MENNLTLDKEYIKNILQDILIKEHSENPKRIIKDFPDRLNFACPICGDSKNNVGKKRGNLYLHNMYYKCFNEPECSRSFVKLLSTFNVEMELEKKLELYEYLDKNIKYEHIVDSELSSLDKIIPLELVVDYFQKYPSRKITDLKPLTEGSEVYNYVVHKRKIKRTEHIYQANFHITDKWVQPVMVFMNMHNGKLLGMQTRNLLEDKKGFFKIYSFSDIYDMIYPNNDMDEQERMAYNKISHYYNILITDLTKIVNIFEGFIDSLSLPNSIGLIGLNTDIKFLMKDDGYNFRFIYDNDKSGFKRATESIKNGYSVFLWNKFFIDAAKLYKGTKPHKTIILELSEKIKDFNKLSSFFNKPIYQIFKLDDYFSNDVLDMEYLMPIDDIIKNGIRIYN